MPSRTRLAHVALVAICVVATGAAAFPLAMFAAARFLVPGDAGLAGPATALMLALAAVLVGTLLALPLAWRAPRPRLVRATGIALALALATWVWVGSRWLAVRDAVPAPPVAPRPPTDLPPTEE